MLGLTTLVAEPPLLYVLHVDISLSAGGLP